MRVQLESTSKVVMLNGELARIWEGATESGIPCHAYITRIACDAQEDNAEFERDLQECVAPSEAVQAIPLRMIL